MNIFKRIGTTKHQYKVQFFLGELKSNIHLKGNIYIVIKRGDHKQTSEQNLSLNEQKKCNFNKQIITFNPVTMYYDEQQKKYQQKQGEIRIILKTTKNEKKMLGKLHFDLAQYINAKKQNLTIKKKLQQSPQQAQISFQYQLFLKFIGEGSEISKQKTGDLKDKRKGSLSKLTGFVEGIFNQKEQKQPQNNLLNDKKSKDSKKFSPKNKSKTKKKSKASKIEEANNSQPIKNTAISQQNKDSDDDLQGSPTNQRPKNLVRVKNRIVNTLTDQQFDNEKVSNKSKPSLKNRQFYFDEKHHQNVDPQPIKKQNKNEVYQGFDNVFKKKQENLNSISVQNSNFKTAQKQTSRSPEPIQNIQNKGKDQNQAKKLQQIQIQLAKAQKIHIQEVKKLTKQNERLLNENNLMKNEIIAIKQEIQNIKQHKIQNSNSYIEPFQTNSQLLTKITLLQKQKGQYLVKIQQMKKKHKRQINELQQQLEKSKMKHQDSDQSAKGQLKRIKDELLDYKHKVEILNKQIEEKSKETSKIQFQNHKTNQELEKALKSLQKLKQKICESLNEANQSGDSSMVQILMHLNDQYLK